MINGSFCQVPTGIVIQGWALTLFCFRNIQSDFQTAPPDKQRPTYDTRRERITKEKRQQEKGKKPLHWWRYSLILNEENNFNIFPKCPPDEIPPCIFQYETVQTPLFWAENVVCGHWGEKLHRQLVGGWLKMVRFGPTGPPMVCFLPTRRQKNANFEMILIMLLILLQTCWEYDGTF